MKRMRWYDYITYNLYWLGLNMASGSLTPFILPFLVAQFVGDAVKGTYLGWLRSAGLIMAIIIQPMAGLLSDRSTARWGRRRPYILVGTALDLVFLILIGLSGNYWLLFVAVLALQFSSNLAHGALQGIIPDLVPEDQRGRASGVKAMMELLPVILVSFVVAPFVGSGRVWIAILIVMASLLATALVTVFAVREEPLRERVGEPLGPPLLRLVMLTFIFAVVAAAFGSHVALIGILLTNEQVARMVAGLVSLYGVGIVWAAYSVLMTCLLLAIAVTLTAMRRKATVTSWRSAARVILLTIFLNWELLLLSGTVGLTVRLLTDSQAVRLVVVGVAGLVAMAGAIVLGVWWSARVGIGPAADQHGSYTWWVVNRLLYLAAIGSIQGFAQYFLKDVMKVANAASATVDLMKVVGLFTVVSALASGWLADKLGRKILVAIAGVVAALGTFLLLTAKDMGMVTICGGIIGLSTGLFMTTNWALGTGLFPAKDAGLYLGISNLAGAGAGVVGSGIGGPMADFFNAYSGGLGWLVVFAIYGALFLLSSITLVKVGIGTAEDAETAKS
jgi:MFS family permease